jgi:hypothetical protein
MRDRIIILAIAFSQFWLSLLLLGLALYAGPFFPLFLSFGLWGMINSFTLPSAHVAAGKSALLWNLIFLVFLALGSLATGNPSPQNSLSWMVELGGFVALGAIYYLARVLGYLGDNDD